ncbi:MAG: type VI secretion system baseplate subunit TssF [Myxococcales bacterium]|nr:type VI secretion system baseplate subunit TssF [Myxococcales bacterium]
MPASTDDRDLPDATRLILAAHAHLLAGIQARIDAGAPAVVDALADLLLPHVLRSVPAATIVAFTPNLTALRARQRIARHRPLLARVHDGTACRFRTCADLDLHPLELLGARLDDRLAAHPQISLTLRAREDFTSVDRLRLYLHHATPTLPATLLLWISRHCTGLRIDAPGHHAVHLPPSAVELVGLQPASHPASLALFPWPDTAPPAHRLLLEHFSLPERAHFIDIVGLDAAAPPVAELTLTLLFDRPPPLPTPALPAFRLHCVPAVNLYEATAEPLHHTAHTREHLLRADGVDPRHMEVHSVVRLTGQPRARGPARGYSPLHDLSPEPGAPRYALRRAPADDGGVDTWICPRAASTDDEILAADLLCTNRNLARALGPGDLGGDAPPAHALIRGYTNLTAVTAPVRPLHGDDAVWHLVAHLGLGARAHDVPALRALLQLLNAPARLHSPLGRANARHIDAIRGLERDLVARIHRGAAVRTIRTRLTLDEAAFPGPGQAFVFAALLDPLFAAAAPFLTASELHVTLAPSSAELSWPPRLAA